MKTLPLIAFVLIQLCMISSCGSSGPEYYKTTAIEVVSVTNSAGTMTVTIREMAETSYYCGAVKTEENVDAITLFFERNKTGSGSGNVQKEIKITNPQLKSLRIGDSGGANVEIWRKP